VSDGNQWNWSIEITDILVQTAGYLEGLEPEAWDSPSLCEGWRIRDVAGHLLWRVGSSAADMIRTAAPLLPADPNPMHAMDRLSLEAGTATPAEIVRRLRRIAAMKLAGEGRTGITELSEALVHTYDMAQPLGVPLAIEAGVTEAVARFRARLLPLPLAVVLENRTLVAADAGWSIGSGPAIEGTARAIVLYLFGRHPLRERSATSA
jgi:uncharacterized protein (TIGR03083 family)